MEQIEHRTVSVNGINMHIAEKGKGEVVLFIHGFPELWYTWRHQIVALADLGYKAVAPDLRGYGDTDAPTDVNSYTCFHIVGDLIALIETLGVDQVFVVAHDWGAIIAWYLCSFRPDKVKALVSLSNPFSPRNPTVKMVDGLRAKFGDDFYICRIQEPGVVEAEIASSGIETTIKNILTSRKPGPTMTPKEIGFAESFGSPTSLPSWLSEEDICYVANKFSRNGFTGPLNYYRNFDRNWELTAPWNGVQVKVPAMLITGDEDLVYTTPGIKEYIDSVYFKQDVPLLQEVVILEGVAHFIQEEIPDKISYHIHDFIKKF